MKFTFLKTGYLPSRRSAMLLERESPKNKRRKPKIVADGAPWVKPKWSGLRSTANKRTPRI